MREIIGWIGRRLILTILCFISFILIQSIWPLNVKPSSASPMETMRMLLVLCAFYSFVIAELVYRSQAPAGKKILGLTVFVFGVVNVQSLNEALYFIDSVGIPAAELWKMLWMGLVRSLLFVLAAVILIPSRQAVPENKINCKKSSVKGWSLRIAALSVIFPVIYYLCGSFLAWQSADVMAYYQNGINISFLPLFSFQIFRGLIWCSLSILALWVIQGKKVEQILVIGLAMGILHAVQIILPSAYMPDAVRHVHLVELLVSITAMGMLSTWLLRENHGFQKAGGK